MNMTTKLRPHTTRRRRAHGERGQALVLAILVMLVLVIGATAVAGMVASNETNAGRERSAGAALTSGEGGLDLAANVVNTNFLNGTTFPTYPTTFSTSVDQYG